MCVYVCVWGGELNFCPPALKMIFIWENCTSHNLRTSWEGLEDRSSNCLTNLHFYPKKKKKMRVLCAATSSMQKETEPTGFLWAPSQLTGGRLTPSGRTGSSAGGSVVRLLQCDCSLWDRRLWCSAQVWSSWRRPSRSAREERRGGSRHGSPNCPLFHPEAWMEDAACLSSGTGRDDVSISTFIYLLIYLFLQSWPGGLRLQVIFASRGRWRWRMHDVT